MSNRQILTQRWIPIPSLKGSRVKSSQELATRTMLPRPASKARVRKTNVQLSKNLGIIGKDGKIDEDVIDGYAKHLKGMFLQSSLQLLARLDGSL